MSSKAIIDSRECVKREIIGIDNSFKVGKKASLSALLNKIEDNTSITDEEVHKLYNIWYNLAMLYARRKSPSLVSYLEGSSTTISELLAIYKQTFSTVYKVDDNLLNWWFNKSKFIDTDNLINGYYTENNYYIIEHNDKLYTLKCLDDSFIIRSIDNFNSVVLNYEYRSYNNSKGYDCSICCDNTSCPHYKSSSTKEYVNGGRTVFCSLDDLRKCGQCEKAGIDHPFDVEFLFEAIAYCLTNRDSSLSSTKRDDYEHLPKPERVDDILVYFGESKKENKLSFLKTIDEVNAIPSSHASPREHYRKGGIRRSYVRKDGTKVRATTVKDTIVNKGHTKATYKFKER